MISVILALALAQLFVGLASLVQTHASVRPSVPHAAWVLNLFLIVFQHWWSLWDFRDLTWTFPTVMFSLIAPSLLFFAATLISPREPEEGVVDLAEHFAHVRRPLMAVVLLSLILVTIDGPMLGTEGLVNRLRAQQVVLILSAGVTLVSARERTHVAAALLATLALLMGLSIRFFPGVIS